MSTKNAGYGKQQLLGSKRITAQHKDLLNALLEDGKSYTVAQADKIVNDFLKRKVND